jgi:hypothetical protein
MKILIAFITVGTLTLPAGSAKAQGQPTKQVVISEVKLEAMAARKPKSKTDLPAKLKSARKSNVVPANPMKLEPTSVKAIK